MSEARQISAAEKQEVLERQGHRCFVDNHPLEDQVEFDHIRPFGDDGPSIMANIGAVCRKHNRDKGSLTLSEYRDRLDLRRFFEGAHNRRLDDLLEDRLGKRGYGNGIQLEFNNGAVTLFLESGPVSAPLAQCPATGERYFFAMLPAGLLRNDSELQPRPLELNRVWELYRHLLTHTQLAPAICRLVDRSISRVKHIYMVRGFGNYF